MTFRRAPFLLAAAAVGFVALVAVELAQPFAYARLSSVYRDALARVGRTTAPNSDLVFLAIDSASTSLGETEDLQQLYGLTSSATPEARALTLMGQQWPWSREVYALVLDRLINAGAKVVIFDLTFPTASDNDAPFRAALERYKDHVVVGSNFTSSNTRAAFGAGVAHARPCDSLIPSLTRDDRLGFTNFWPDTDDVVRRAQFRVTLEQVQGKTPDPQSPAFLSLAGSALVQIGKADAVPAGFGDNVLRFTAPPRIGFPPHSLFEIFVPEYWRQNYGNGDFFRGKIVLIGAEGNWQHDEHTTPFGLMPGPELHLNAINAALQAEFIRELSPLATALLIALAGALACAVMLLLRSPWVRVASVVVLNVAAAALVLWTFNRASIYVPAIAPGLELNGVVLLALAADYAGERIERKRLRRTLERYVSRNVVRDLLDDRQLYADSLGGVVKPVAILFSDIRGYSSVSAKTDPQALVAQLNEYLTAMVDCVFATGGTLDKFVGDAVMAVWGNTRSAVPRDDAASAVRAAVAMRRKLAKLNASWRERGLSELRIGIAVNCGDVVVGNIGSPQRMEFTVVGDAVNVTWKLQELTKRFGCDLIVPENVAGLIVEEFDLQSLGQVAVREDAPMNLYGVLGAIDPRATPPVPSADAT